MLITSLCLVLAAVPFLPNTASQEMRLCVADSAMQDCQAMKREPALVNTEVQCVSSPDRSGCMEKLAAKTADVMMVTGEDAFTARELYGANMEIVAETRYKETENDASVYQGMAVVKRSAITGLSDLKGAMSCHTGYARTAGWNIPFSHLLEKGLIRMQCETNATVVEHDIRATSMFFGQACVPGSWAPDNATDFKLKRKYSNMCALCRTPQVCGMEDAHAGYEGALRCLVDGQGQVAWTKMSAVQDFFNAKSEADRSAYGLLCPDGRVVDLGTSAEECNWATKPWNGWLVHSESPKKKTIVSTLAALTRAASPPQQDTRQWAASVLKVLRPSMLHIRSVPATPRDYLKEHKYDTTIERLGCNETPVKLCVDSRFAMEKCEALRPVLKSYRIRPALECVTPIPGEDCVRMVASGAAHITSADGGDVHRARKKYNLVPVVSERYGLLDASYFAVAVVRADSGITSLSQLRGKKSCHTGIQKTAGWKIPVVTLQKAGLLPKDTCDFEGEMGRFFSSSCVPGAKMPPYDPDGSNPQSLCDLCIGDPVTGEGKCDRGAIEAFSGYTGAFRCLVEGGGDVAFIKHTTVRENTNGNNNASWAAGLLASNFKLLCRDTSAAEVFDYNNCHLARVPAHKVLINHKLSEVIMEEVRIMLLRASDRFPPGNYVFRMFGPFKGKQDLIFKDSATALIDVRVDAFHQSIDDLYYQTLDAMDACKEGGKAGPLVGNAASASSHVLAYLMLCVALVHFLA